MSYAYVKDHDVEIDDIDFIPYYENILADYDPGTTSDVTLHDGSHIRLRKLADLEHDVHDRMAALRVIHQARDKGELLTGLLYINPEQKDLCELESLPLDELKSLNPAFENDFYAAVKLQAVLDCHDVVGGTARGRVKSALADAKERITKIRGGAAYART